VRRLIMWNLVSLDGFFEASRGDLSFHQYAGGPDLESFVTEQCKSVGGLLFGRITYEGMAAFWRSQHGEVADFMNAVPKVVFSKSLEKAEWNNSRLVTSNAELEVTRLKREVGQDLFIFGSGQLTSTLTTHGLIDEYRIGLVPILLGRGTPLFRSDPSPIKLKLLEARPMDTGCLLLRYAPDPSAK